MTPEAGEALGLAAVSEALGVHYMTAYRYVRTGVLPATQSGGQWRVSAAAVEALLTQRAAGPTQTRGRRPRSGGSLAGAASAGDVRRPWNARPDLLTERLLAGDATGAWTLVESALVSGASPTDIHVGLLVPALVEVGDRWATHEVTVGQEHGATSVATRIIGRLSPRFARSGRTRGTVVLATPQGERHALPSALVADQLRGTGVHVLDLGADVPAPEVAETAARQDRLLAVGIAATTPLTDAARRRCGRLVHLVQDRVGVPVFLGGAAITEASAGAIGAEQWTADARDVTAFVNSLHARAPGSRIGSTR